jgi:UTP:GlnB (protein PII) uridylyltransferase
MSLATNSTPNTLRHVSRNEAPRDFVDDFLAGMPESYQTQYSDSEKRQHAQIAWRRGTALVHVEICPPGRDGFSWICVVTDDGRGLLSKLSAAISAYSLDILGAKTFCRTRDGAKTEALGLFAVRRLRELSSFEQLDQDEIDAICNGIASLLEGQTDLAALKRRGWPTERPGESPPPDVFFGSDGDCDLLSIEAQDHPGLLSDITSALFRVGVRVLWSDVLTVGGRACDAFAVCEPDGSRVTEAHKKTIVEHLVRSLS